MDRLGRQHRRGAKGRFARKDGSVVSARLAADKALLPGVDARSTNFKRYRSIVVALTADAGGVDLCSESRKQLIRRFASCSVLAEMAEAKLAAGEEIDVQKHALLCSTLTRLVSRLGIDRVAKDVGPTLSDYLPRASP